MRNTIKNEYVTNQFKLVTKNKNNLTQCNLGDNRFGRTKE